ncbi:MAG: hypothetical protein QM749_07555 [Aquabacterium sp.]
MITTYESPKLWQRTWFLALVLGAGVGVAAWWWQTHAQPAVEPPVAEAKPVAPARRPVDVALLVPPKIMDDGRPADFSPEDWAALKDALSKTANPRAELERIVKYLRFQKGFEQWQALQEGPDVATRRRLAERLMEQVPERMAQGEMTYGEAQMLESALLADIEPNEEMRKQRLERAQSLLRGAAPKADGEQQVRDASLLAEYKRREAAIMAAFQALPEDKRDQLQLGKDLDAARVAVYGSKK